MTFGTFPPGCVNPACDDMASMQCWVDREGSTLQVHSKYYGYHKEGSSCSEGCLEIVAGCDTPELEAGTYTVQYSKHSYELQIPSSLNKPCYPLK